MTLAFFAACLLAAVHIMTPSLRFLEGTPRSVWLSAAGGVSVAYVFVHLLPELASGQAEVSERFKGDLFFAERHIYLIALAGLLIFFGLDRMAKLSRSRREGTALSGGRGNEAGEPAAGPWVFRIHMASFAVYNMLVGYLLVHREESGPASTIFFTVAMALHFVVTDYGLNEDHRHSYRQVGRWVLVGAAFAGWLIGATTELSGALVASLMALLGGGVILNVIKEEVPSERQSRFSAFLGGATLYAVLLLGAA